MSKNVNNKLAQHSKENRIMNAMQIRAGSQEKNIYQQHHDKQNKYPDRRVRKDMTEMFEIVPVKRVDDTDSFVQG